MNPDRLVMKGFPEPRHRGRNNMRQCYMERLSCAGVQPGRMMVQEYPPGTDTGTGRSSKTEAHAFQRGFSMAGENGVVGGSPK
jgi:hypothetical protein